ncbi:MAG: hypothetical protein L0H41_12525, partial [Microlunatus sp.]|nr:hypothetical protein [Microlunatus sp.]
LLIALLAAVSGLLLVAVLLIALLAAVSGLLLVAVLLIPLLATVSGLLSVAGAVVTTLFAMLVVVSLVSGRWRVVALSLLAAHPIRLMLILLGGLLVPEFLSGRCSSLGGGLALLPLTGTRPLHPAV